MTPLKPQFILSLLLTAAGLSLSAQTLNVPDTIGASTIAGNVGIGTTAPTSKLDVTDSIAANPLFVGVYNTNDTGRVGLKVGVSSTSNTSATFQVFNPTYSDGTNSPSSLVIAANSNLTGGMVLRQSAAGSMYFQTNGAINRMTIDSSGNVGIGTTNPQVLLHLSSSANPSTGLSIENTATGGRWYSFVSTQNGAFIGGGKFSLCDNTAAAHRLTIDSSGNVGIGTTAPAYRMHVVSSTNQVSMGVGEPSSSTVALTGHRVAAWDDGNVYLDAKIGAGGAVVYRYGEGAQTGGTNTWMILKSGNVGIGTASPSHKLSVNGTIRAKEVVVDTGWSDYVFAKEYRLAPLSEVAQHIEREGHLPGIPSAAEIATSGVSLGDMQARLLAKVEELTLHLIAQEQRTVAQGKEISRLKAELGELRGNLAQ